jgi:hypothetical protein
VRGRSGPARAPLAVALAVASIVLVAGCGSTTPSPSPAPTIGVEVTPNPNLVAFQGQITRGAARETDLVQALAKATAGSRADLGLAAGQMTQWTTAEDAWLDSHPADACYRDAFDAYRSGVRDIATAAVAFVKLAAAPSPATDAEGQAAAATISTGTTSIDGATALAKAARAVCG